MNPGLWKNNLLGSYQLSYSVIQISGIVLYLFFILTGTQIKGKVFYETSLQSSITF